MTNPSHLQSVSGEAARFTASDDEVVDNGNGAQPPSSGGRDTSRSTSKGRPERPIPTDRLSWENQLDVLLKVATLSGNTKRGSTAEDMSAAIGLRSGTGGLNSRFFRAANWFEAVGRGNYTASQGVLDYQRHISIDPEGHAEATAGMREEVKDSWFWKVVEPLLSSGQPVPKRLVLLTLAREASASDHQVQLETIIQWLEWVHLIHRDGDQVQLAVAVTEQAPAEDSGDDTTETTDELDDTTLVDVAVEEQVVPAKPARHASPDQEPEAAALLSFNLSVRITADDMHNLTDEQAQFLMSFAEKLRG